MQPHNQKDNAIIHNTKVKDSGCKVIFDNNILCSQFLRDYIDLPHMKSIRPEDIEDVSAQFVPLVAEERNADRVKKVSVKGEQPFFLISLLEHKTRIDYNISMQIFRYMFLIWDAYEKEAERVHEGISRQESFRYPPILPIVYYEGKPEWTVPERFVDRISNGKDFGEYLPDFRYYLVPLRDYSNERLMAKRDEISLAMMINKMQTKDDIEAFRALPADDIQAIVRDSPRQLVDVIADVLLAFLLKVNVPISEAELLTDKVREKKVAELFADMEKLDIQAERRNTEEQQQRAESAERKAEVAEQEAERAKQKAEAAEQRAEAAEQKAKTARQNAETANQMIEASISSLIESYQDRGMSWDSTLQKLMGKLGLEEAAARSKIELYWDQKGETSSQM